MDYNLITQIILYIIGGLVFTLAISLVALWLKTSTYSESDLLIKGIIKGAIGETKSQADTNKAIEELGTKIGKKIVIDWVKQNG